MTSQGSEDLRESPLYIALKRFSTDIVKVLELASKEEPASWDRIIDLAKDEVENGELLSKAASKYERMVFQSLIAELYEHLGMLVRTLKVSEEKYKRLATRDLLTGLYNRNYFNETMVRDIERARRNHEMLSFILIDVNGFKRINDTFGHLHGDGVLRECASILRKSVRKSDFLCRYGGDEFVIVTPQPSCKDNDPLFERIRENLNAWNSEFATFDYRISFSIGCSMWSQGRDVMEVLHEADMRMYEHKKRRRED